MFVSLVAGKRHVVKLQESATFDDRHVQIHWSASKRQWRKTFFFYVCNRKSKIQVKCPIIEYKKKNPTFYQKEAYFTMLNLHTKYKYQNSYTLQTNLFLSIIFYVPRFTTFKMINQFVNCKIIFTNYIKNIKFTMIEDEEGSCSS